jgi:alpha-galactosidase
MTTRNWIWFLASVTVSFAAINAGCQTPAARIAMQSRDQWFVDHLAGEKPPAPFSFLLDGERSDKALGSWPKTSRKTMLDANRTQRTLTWADQRTGLEVRCVAVEYADFPVVEWTVYLKNTGTGSTPIVKDAQGLDARFPVGPGDTVVLHGIKGDYCTADSYEPYAIRLGPNTVERFAPPLSGKSCDGPRGWPYFNLQTPGGGVILAVGWPGQWAASFSRGESGEVRITAGQELTHLYLKPGEEIRTPLIAMLFWQGDDVVSAQNLWRRWYVAHNMPRVGGRPQPPISQIQVDGSEQTSKYVDKFLKAGIKPDICWRDAGAGATTWYPSDTGPYKGKDAWLSTGTWEIDRRQYPQGFRPFSDWAHSRGMGFVLWFEPERVGDPGSWLGKNHPEWLLPGTSHGALLDEGNPEARNWLINHIDGMIKSQGIDWYREDMNGGGPLPAWRKNDAPDRQGITENLYVQGHLAFWDELKRRNPSLRIDSCASGGRRNDLETMRRAVPLLRSDFQFPDMPGVVEGNQGHTYGLSFWLPFQGSGVYSYDAYAFRSFYMASFGMGTLTPENTAAQQQAYAECRKIAPLMLADYYPLTEYSLAVDQWIAWQFNRPEENDGVVQVFRRGACPESTKNLRLRGLEAAAQYAITNLDDVTTETLSGRQLTESGLKVEINNKPGAAVVMYRKAR